MWCVVGLAGTAWCPEIFLLAAASSGPSPHPPSKVGPTRQVGKASSSLQFNGAGSSLACPSSPTQSLRPQSVFSALLSLCRDPALERTLPAYLTGWQLRESVLNLLSGSQPGFPKLRLGIREPLTEVGYWGRQPPGSGWPGSVPRSGT